MIPLQLGLLLCAPTVVPAAAAESFALAAASAINDVLSADLKTSPTQCQKPDGSIAPCGPGNDLCHGEGYGRASPQYHIHDFSCGMNDPAAVIYDPVHGIYHQHWEDHLARPGGQYVRGHAVSRDMTHWARMPVSLWNDRPYDAYAIFTGSATLVNGSVVQVYPGLCQNPKKGEPCPGATNLAIAVPEDPTDPLHTNWTKDGKVGAFTGYTNPIVNNTGRDPSTAWRTPAGEWRLTSYGSQIFGSTDFKSWYRIGQQKAFPQGECPSFFPLPQHTPGAMGPAPAGAGTPTHVYKTSHGGKDWMVVGTYEAGPLTQLGTYNATPGVPHAQVSLLRPILPHLHPPSTSLCIDMHLTLSVRL